MSDRSAGDEELEKIVAVADEHLVNGATVLDVVIFMFPEQHECIAGDLALIKDDGREYVGPGWSRSHGWLWKRVTGREGAGELWEVSTLVRPRAWMSDASCISQVSARAEGA